MIARAGLFLILAAWAAVGCAFTRTPSQTLRTATEQLLLSTALDRSLTDLTVPLAEGSSIAIQAVGFAVPPVAAYVGNVDLDVVRAAVAGRIGELGFLIRDKPDQAQYLAHIIIQSLGTVQGETFFGMPPVQSVIIPFSLPELTLYKQQAQAAHMRYWIDLYEVATGRFIRSTPIHMGSAYYNQYTFLFLIKFHTTDLTLPP